MNEISPTTRLYANGDKNEPLYTINVALDSQTIDAYGQAQTLKPGMQLGADVELDVRRIYEWILEPLFSMKKS
jgi:membrane fusion protein